MRPNSDLFGTSSIFINLEIIGQTGSALCTRVQVNADFSMTSS